MVVVLIVAGAKRDERTVPSRVDCILVTCQVRDVCAGQLPLASRARPHHLLPRSGSREADLNRASVAPASGFQAASTQGRHQ